MNTRFDSLLMNDMGEYHWTSPSLSSVSGSYQLRLESKPFLHHQSRSVLHSHTRQIFRFWFNFDTNLFGYEIALMFLERRLAISYVYVGRLAETSWDSCLKLDTQKKYSNKLLLLLLDCSLLTLKLQTLWNWVSYLNFGGTISCLVSLRSQTDVQTDRHTESDGYVHKFLLPVASGVLWIFNGLNMKRSKATSWECLSEIRYTKKVQ